MEDVLDVGFRKRISINRHIIFRAICEIVASGADAIRESGALGPVYSPLHACGSVTLKGKQ